MDYKEYACSGTITPAGGWTRSAPFRPLWIGRKSNATVSGISLHAGIRAAVGPGDLHTLQKRARRALAPPGPKHAPSAPLPKPGSASRRLSCSVSSWAFLKIPVAWGFEARSKTEVYHVVHGNSIAAVNTPFRNNIPIPAHTGKRNPQAQAQPMLAGGHRIKMVEPRGIEPLTS